MLEMGRNKENNRPSNENQRSSTSTTTSSRCTYKRYLTDSNVPVPRSTLSTWRSNANKIARIENNVRIFQTNYIIPAYVYIYILHKAPISCFYFTYILKMCFSITGFSIK